MIKEPTRVENLVAEKANLTLLEREIEVYLARIRLGNRPREEGEQKRLRRWFWRRDRYVGEATDRYEEIPGVIVHEFYAFLIERRSQIRHRLYEIDADLESL